jgi:Cu2+-containing amine oxidase
VILPLPREKSDSADLPKLSTFRPVSKNNSFRPDTNYHRMTARELKWHEWNIKIRSESRERLIFHCKKIPSVSVEIVV